MDHEIILIILTVIHLIGHDFRNFLKLFFEVKKDIKKDARISPDTVVTVPTSCPVGTRLVHLIIYCCNIKTMQCHYNFNRFIISFTSTSFSSGFYSAIINVIATNVPSLSLFSPSKNNALFLSKNSKNSDAAILLQPSAYG